MNGGLTGGRHDRLPQRGKFWRTCGCSRRLCSVTTIRLVSSRHDSRTNCTVDGLTGHWSRTKDERRPILGAMDWKLEERKRSATREKGRAASVMRLERSRTLDALGPLDLYAPRPHTTIIQVRGTLVIPSQNNGTDNLAATLGDGGYFFL